MFHEMTDVPAALIHGGNVFEAARRLGCAPEEILDFSASINPLGPPPGLLEVVIKAFELVRHYPDIANRAFVEAVSERFRIDADRIAVGNGSTELIYALPYALGTSRVLAVVPTFKEYLQAFSLSGSRVDLCVAAAEHHFQPTVHQLEQALEAKDPEAVLVTHPGSPSGSLLPQNVRRFLLEQSRVRNFTLVVDEVFVDFCEEESLLEELTRHDRLILIRSLTKFYGIPGLRLGYGLTSSALAERLRRRIPPWSVNTLAQAAGVYCFQQGSYREKTVALVREERMRLSRALARIPGLTVFPSAANYVLVRLDHHFPTAAELKENLLVGRRLLIRDCANFDGLTPRDFRVAVRLPRENDRLIEALAAWCGFND